MDVSKTPQLPRFQRNLTQHADDKKAETELSLPSIADLPVVTKIGVGVWLYGSCTLLLQYLTNNLQVPSEERSFFEFTNPLSTNTSVTLCGLALTLLAADLGRKVFESDSTGSGEQQPSRDPQWARDRQWAREKASAQSSKGFTKGFAEIDRALDDIHDSLSKRYDNELMLKGANILAGLLEGVGLNKTRLAHCLEKFPKAYLQYLDCARQLAANPDSPFARDAEAVARLLARHEADVRKIADSPAIEPLKKSRWEPADAPQGHFKMEARGMIAPLPLNLKDLAADVGRTLSCAKWDEQIAILKVQGESIRRAMNGVQIGPDRKDSDSKGSAYDQSPDHAGVLEAAAIMEGICAAANGKDALLVSFLDWLPITFDAVLFATRRVARSGEPSALSRVRGLAAHEQFVHNALGLSDGKSRDGAVPLLSWEYLKVLKPSAVTEKSTQSLAQVQKKVRLLQSVGDAEGDPPAGYVPTKHFYPHVHVDKNCVVLSRRSDDHLDLIRGDQYFEQRMDQLRSRLDGFDRGTYRQVRMFLEFMRTGRTPKDV